MFIYFGGRFLGGLGGLGQRGFVLLYSGGSLFRVLEFGGVRHVLFM